MSRAARRPAVTTCSVTTPRSTRWRRSPSAPSRRRSAPRRTCSTITTRRRRRSTTLVTTTTTVMTHDGHDGHDDHHDAPHESGPLLLVPIVILAVLSATVGFLNATPIGEDWERFKVYIEPRSAAVEIEDYLVATGPGESIELRNPMVVAPGVLEAGDGGADERRPNRGRGEPVEGETARARRARNSRPWAAASRHPKPERSASCRRRTTPSPPSRRSCSRSVWSPVPTPSPSRSASPSTVAGTGGSSASPNARGSCGAGTCSSRTSTTSTRSTRASSFVPSPTRSPTPRTGSTST